MAKKKEEITEYSKFEKARLIGSRALQLAMGAPLLIKLKETELEELNYNPIEIAKREFNEGILPITVTRPLPIPEKLKKKPETKAI